MYLSPGVQSEKFHVKMFTLSLFEMLYDRKSRRVHMKLLAFHVSDFRKKLYDRYPETNRVLIARRVRIILRRQLVQSSKTTIGVRVG